MPVFPGDENSPGGFTMSPGRAIPQPRVTERGFALLPNLPRGLKAYARDIQLAAESGLIGSDCIMSVTV